LVITVMPVSEPGTAVFLRVTPDTVTMKIPAVTAAVPVNTNFVSVKVEEILYPEVISAPLALTPGAAAQPTTPVAVKNPEGQPMVIEFCWVAAQFPVAVGRLVVMVNVKTGATIVDVLRLANGIIMDTAVTAGAAGPTVPESVHVVV